MKIKCFCLLFCLFCYPQISSASTITISFSGHVTSIEGIHIPTGYEIGMKFKGYFYFDDQGPLHFSFLNPPSFLTAGGNTYLGNESDGEHLQYFDVFSLAAPSFNADFYCMLSDLWAHVNNTSFIDQTHGNSWGDFIARGTIDSYTVTTVPESSAFVLLGLGLLGLLFWRQRRPAMH